MAKKTFDKPITKNTPWDGDVSTDNLPVSGYRIEEFVKKSLDGKAGYFQYHNGKILVFADAESWNEYCDDETKDHLILGAFDAMAANYMNIILDMPSRNTILHGDVGNYIRFTVGTYTSQGDIEVLESRICTYTITCNGRKQTIVKQYNENETDIEFLLDEYIKDYTGTVTVRINMSGLNSFVASSTAVVYEIINLGLSDSFDISRVYDTSIEIPYTLSGTGVKIVEFYIDDIQQTYNRDSDEITSETGSKVKYIDVSGLSEGVHSLQMKGYTTIDGEKKYTPLYYREFFISRNHDVMVTYYALSLSYPLGHPLIIGAPTIEGIKQFEPATLQFATYNNSGDAITDVGIYMDEELQSTMQSRNGVASTYTLLMKDSGTKTLRIGSREFTLDVSATRLNLSEITDNLTLALDAVSKTNESADRASWKYGSIETVFTGFAWNEQSGWNNGKLVIPEGASITVGYAPLSTDAAKTIEFEFSTVNVKDGNTMICNMCNAMGTGLYITADHIMLRSRFAATTSDTIINADGVAVKEGEVGTKFKAGETYRIGFVITPKQGVSNKCMAFIYVNGELTGATSFKAADNYVSNSNIVISGSAGATVHLRSIRCYNAALSDDQMLNNYTLYRPTVEEMLRVYNRNDILENGRFTAEKLKSTLPVAIITGDIPSLEATSDKKFNITVDIEFINLQNQSKNFVWKNVYLEPQGTSSMFYPRKNLRPRIDKDQTICYDASNTINASKKYAHTEKGQPVHRWTWKADFAESSGTHNAGIAKLWNDVMYNATINDRYVLRTNVQQTAASHNYPYDVRTTVDGFPMVVFYRLTPNDDLVFMGKYNFLNDKSTENVFGFKGIGGTLPDGSTWEADTSKVECWECLANKEDMALFKNTDDWDNKWSQSFEARFPDGNKNTANLKRLCEWLCSCRNSDGTVNIEKFRSEKADYLDVNKVIAYYIYLMRFGAVDQPVKNSMLTTEDGLHWFFINYDNDTINGVRNDGQLKYSPSIDRRSIDTELNDYCYAGHDSTLWNCIEGDSECMDLVPVIDSALQSAGLTYNNVIKMFNETFAGKWCERVYNQDANYKYISSYIDRGVNYLASLQGSRKAHREWWLSNRFSLLDSKWITGDYKANIFKILAPADGVKNYNFSIKAASKLYYGWGVNNVIKESGIELNPGESHTFTTNQQFAIGDPISIYGVPHISEIDIHEMGNAISTIDMSGVYSKVLGTSLEKLIIGGEDVENTALTPRTFSGLSFASKLKHLDIRGMHNLTSLEIEGLTQLETLLADRTGLTSFKSTNSNLSNLQLPGTIVELVLENLSKLNVFSMESSSLHSLVIKNCSFDCYELLKGWILSLPVDDDDNIINPQDYHIEITGVNWTGKSSEEILSLGSKIKQIIDASPDPGNKSVLTGKIKVSSITEDNYQDFMEVLGEDCFNSRSALYIHADSGLLVFYPREITEGQSGQITIFGNEGTKAYYLVLSGSDRVSVNSKGLITVRETGAAGAANIRVTLEGSSFSQELPITIRQAVYPTLSAIDGHDLIAEDTEYTYALTEAAGQTSVYKSVRWELSGEAVIRGFVSLASDTSDTCRVVVLENPDEGQTAACSLRCTLYKHSGQTVTLVKSVTVMEYDEIICYNNGTIAEPEPDTQFANTSVFMTNGQTKALGDKWDVTFFSCDKSVSMYLSSKDVEGRFYPQYNSNNYFSKDTVFCAEFTRKTEPLDGYVLTGQLQIEQPSSEMRIKIEANVNNAWVTVIEGLATEINRTDAKSPVGKIYGIRMTISVLQAMSFSKNYYPVLFFNIAKEFMGTAPDGGHVNQPLMKMAGLCGWFRKDPEKQKLYKSDCRSAVLPSEISSLASFDEFEHFRASSLPKFYNLTSIKLPPLGFVLSADTFIQCSFAYLKIPESFLNIYVSSFAQCVIGTLDLGLYKNAISMNDYRGATFENVSVDAENERYHLYKRGVYDGRKLVAYFRSPDGDDIELEPDCEDLCECLYHGRQLGDFVLQDGIKTLRRYCFYMCSFNSISLPESLIDIEMSAFAGTVVDTVIMPDSVVSVPSHMFKGSSVRKVVFGNGVVSIGDYCFISCSSLEEVTIPNTVTTLGVNIFQGCTMLKKVYVPNHSDTLNDRIISMLSSTVGKQWYFNADTECIELFPRYSITLTSGETVTASSLSEVSKALVERIVVNEGTMNIENIDYYDNLKTLVIADSVTSGSFVRNCTKLESITIGSGISSLGNYFLYNCMKLKSIICKSPVAPGVGSSSFGVSAYNYVGYSTKAQGNILYVPMNATGYDIGLWADPLQNPDKCGFTISKTL